MRRFYYGFVFVMLLLYSLGSVTVSAAKRQNGYVEMHYSKEDTYSADVTGDHIKDVITLSNDAEDEYRSLSVNGVVVKKWNLLKGFAWVSVFDLSDQSYMAITEEHCSKGKTDCGIYKIADGKLKCVLDYKTLVNKKLLYKSSFISEYDVGWDMFNVTKVKGNVIEITAELVTRGLGQVTIKKLKIIYKNGKFTLKNTAGKATYLILHRKTRKKYASFKAKEKIKVYKKAGSSKSAGFYIAKNQNFKITHAVIYKKNLYIKVKTKGKKGWIKLNKRRLVEITALL